MEYLRSNAWTISSSPRHILINACNAWFFACTNKGRHELRCGNFKINVHSSGKELVPHAANIMPGSADFCLEVDDELEDILKTVREKGFVIELEKTINNGFYGKMTSIYLRDPVGNLVEYCVCMTKKNNLFETP